MRWDDVKPLFDTENYGALPDVVMEGTGVEDWQLLLDLIRDRGWKSEYVRDGESFPLPSAVDFIADNALLKVWPVPEILAIFRAYSAESIDFDVDLRELQGQERLDVLVGFLTAIGRRLGRSVLMYPEGSDHDPVLGSTPEPGGSCCWLRTSRGGGVWRLLTFLAAAPPSLVGRRAFVKGL